LLLRLATALLGLILIALTLDGCGATPLLSDVTVTPATISPNGDGRDDVAVIRYRFGQPGTVTIALVDSQGRRFVFRHQEVRPAGDYQARFSGVVASALPLGGLLTAETAQVLPDGPYAVLVEATSQSGETAKVELPLRINGGDTTQPILRDFAVFTPLTGRDRPPEQEGKVVFTPNRDGISDRIVVSYYLEKDSRVEVYLAKLDDPKGTKYPLPLATAGKQVETPKIAYRVKGHYEHEYEGGVDLGNTPPPNGEYLVVGEATDNVGNHTVVTAPLTIADGGVPLAEIVSARFTPEVVAMGQLLRVEITVENVGPVAIRSKGPYSGTIYLNNENYNSKSATEKGDYREEPGVFRVGVDYEGNSEGREYPYRWGFSGDLLQPGERQTIVGYIRIIEPTRPHNPVFWTGLIHEQVRKVNDKYKPTRVTIAF